MSERITVDTNIERTINIHVNKDHIINFSEIESGLYMYDVKDAQKLAMNLQDTCS